MVNLLAAAASVIGPPACVRGGAADDARAVRYSSCAWEVIVAISLPGFNLRQ